MGTAPRLAAVDALRGLALAGMAVVHFQYYAAGPPAWGDRVEAAIALVFTERFYALFAFLFGVGFALQLERWGDKAGFVAIYVRRLLTLAAFGFLLVAVTGYRVLIGYAFWGFALLLMRRWSPPALTAAAVAILLAGPAVNAARWQVERRTIGVDASNVRASEESRRWPEYHRRHRELSERGEFGALAAYRVSFAAAAFKRWTHYIPGPDLLMFVLGLLAVRIGALADPARHRRLLAFVVACGLLLGLSSAMVPVSWASSAAAGAERLRLALLGLHFAVFNPMFQGLAYGAVLLLWISRAAVLPRLCAWLADAGHMSLTNYIVQIAALELYEAAPAAQMTRPVALLAAVAFFSVQVVYTRWWFRRFRIGPLEWLWRSATYMRVQPLRLHGGKRVAIPNL